MTTQAPYRVGRRHRWWESQAVHHRDRGRICAPAGLSAAASKRVISRTCVYSRYAVEQKLAITGPLCPVQTSGQDRWQLLARTMSRIGVSMHHAW